MSQSLTTELHAQRTRSTSESQILERLAQRCSASGYRIACDMLNSPADAEDAVQEALAIACQRVDEVQRPDAIVSWFHRILVRHCLRRLRRRKIGKALGLLWPGERSSEPEAIVDPTGSAEASLAEQQRRRGLLAAVHSLPPRQKAAVVLRYGHDHSIAEIAEILELGTGSIRTHLRRGLQALRAANLGA